MGKIYVLYNPLAGNKTCVDTMEKLNSIYEGKMEYVDFSGVSGDLERFFNRLEEEDKVIICGGDGTLNYFVNAIDADKIENEVLYFPAGSGNDFGRDIQDKCEGPVYSINRYISNLPYVEIDGVRKRFINGIGFGIDGYCCEEGDKIRIKRPGKRVNYTTIALKGLLYDYKRTNAVVTVDGKVYEFEDVWMVPSMHGRYYGGGMMCAPNQDRDKHNNKVSVIVVSSKNRLRLLTAFASIFDGGHLKYTNIVRELKGSEVKVEFDSPKAVQIDGETVKNVKSYSIFRS